MASRNAKRGEYKINRFPIAEIVHYAVAKKMGFEDNLAKALANASAVFYALAKNGAFKGVYKSKRGKFDIPKHEANEIVKFGKLAFKVHGDAVIFGDKMITAREYDRSILSKLSPMEYDRIHKYALKYVEKVNDIKDPFKVYKAVRDEWRKWEFWEKLQQEIAA